MRVTIPSARFLNWTTGDEPYTREWEWPMPTLRLIPLASDQGRMIWLPTELLDEKLRQQAAGEHCSPGEVRAWPLHYARAENLFVQQPLGGEFNEWQPINLYFSEEAGDCSEPMEASHFWCFGEEFTFHVPQHYTASFILKDGTQYTFSPAQPVPLVSGKTVWECIRQMVRFSFSSANLYRRNHKFFRATDLHVTHEKMKYHLEPRADQNAGGRFVFSSDKTYEFPQDYMREGLVMLGVNDDLSGFKTFSSRWSYLPEGLQHVDDHIVREQSVPWNRVFIHRGKKKWRFLFALEGRSHSHYYNRQDLTQSLPIIHLIPVVVDHEETSNIRKAWRGLPLVVQEAIWGVPGMSSAMTHALIMLRNRVSELEKHHPLSWWPSEPIRKMGHSICFPGHGHVINLTFEYRVRQMIESGQTHPYLHQQVSKMATFAGRNTIVPAVQHVANAFVSKREIEL